MVIIARNKVSDIDAFLKGGQERNDLFATAASSWQTFQDKDDPTSVVLEIRPPAKVEESCKIDVNSAN